MRHTALDTNLTLAKPSRRLAWLACFAHLGCSGRPPDSAPIDAAVSPSPDSSALVAVAMDSFFAALHEAPRGRQLKVVSFKRDAGGFHLQLEVATNEPTFGGGGMVHFDKRGRFLSIELHQ